MRAKKKFNLHGYIFGALRKIWRWWPPRKKALDIAQVFEHGNKDPWYVCAVCENVWPRKQVHVDHIKPVINPKYGFQTWDIYIKRLFVTEKYLQVLCLNCHKDKSNLENKQR